MAHIGITKKKVVFFWPGAAHALTVVKLNPWLYSAQLEISANLA